MARCCPASSHGPGERRGRVRACHPLPTMMPILDLFKSICCGYYCFCHLLPDCSFPTIQQSWHISSDYDQSRPAAMLPSLDVAAPTTSEEEMHPSRCRTATIYTPPSFRASSRVQMVRYIQQRMT